MTKPKFTLDKIKFATDSSTFDKAVKLYNQGKVTRFLDNEYTYTAIVLGTSPYEVIVDGKNYDRGRCNCYLGQRDILCKHMVAVAIYALKQGQTLDKEDAKQITKVVFGNKIGQLNAAELAKTKKSITQAMRYIKPYYGPSRIWFAYQDSLSEGCNRLTAIVSALPASMQTARLLVNLLLRLDKKISYSGVDDSDGTVGGFIEEVVVLLQQFANLEPACIQAFTMLVDRETCFGWEAPLVRILDEHNIDIPHQVWLDLDT